MGADFHILYIAFIRLPTEKAHGAQIVKTCEALADAGATIDLMVPGRKTHITEDLFSYYGARKTFSIHTVKAPDWVSLGAIGFALSVLWFSEMVKLTKRFWKADVIYSRDAFVLLQYILLGRKLVYEAHTQPTFISTLVAKKAHRVIVISEGLRNAYRSKGVHDDRIVVAHDAIDLQPFKKVYNQKEERIRLGIPTDKKIALYVGRVDDAKGAGTFAAASEHLESNIQCVLIGSGPLKQSLQKQYPQSLFLPETPYGELARVLATANVLVLPNSGRNETMSQYTSPLKAFAYMAAKKPIVSAQVPALQSIFTESTTEFFDPDNPVACASAIHTALSRDFTYTVPHTWHDRADVILNSF